MTDARELEVASARFYAAVNQLQRGDPEPMFALWSHSPDVLNLGPRGGRQQGWEAVRAYFAHAASRAAANPAAVRGGARDIVSVIVGEIAYVAAMEEVQVASDRNVQRFTARATNIYRRAADDWKLVYRHADAPPIAPEFGTTAP